MKFTKDEINKYNTHFSKIFKDYCFEHNFNVHSVTSELTSMHKFYLGPKNIQYPATFNINTLDSDKYFKDHQFFNNDLKIVSPIQISDDLQQFIKPKDFWQYADNRLDKKGQVLFQRIINKTFQAHAFQSLMEQRSDEQKWFYIKHIHDGERKAGTQGEFNIFFNFVKTQKLDTDEKIKNFYVLCKHSRNIIKKPEYNPVVCDFVNQNIPQSFHESFEVLLGRKVKRDFKINDTSDIMLITSSQTMTLQKDKCYDKFKFSDEAIPSINILNSLNFGIVRALKNKCMDELGLSDILIVPFTSENNYSKITFEFSSVEHRKNMPDIYVELAAQCSLIYKDQTGNNENIENYVVTSVSHFLLEQKLSKKDNSNPRVKI